MPETLHRPDYNWQYTRYRVTITQTGPRGGKRPPLIDALVRAGDWNDAVEYVEQEFLRRTRTAVSAG